MFESLVVGGGFAFAAAAQPGPLQAFLLSRVVEKGWRQTLPAAFAPLLSDGPIALLAVLVFGRLSDGLTRALQVGGGVLLLWLAWSAFQGWRRDPALPAAASAAPRTLIQAAIVNLLNPNPYLGWTFVLGPALVRAWRRDPVHAVALVAAFYSTMVIALAATIVVFGATRWLGPRNIRLMVLLSAAVLAALGAYQLGAAFLSSRPEPALGPAVVGAGRAASSPGAASPPPRG